MATSSYGWAQLDLTGNRITWDPSDTQHDKILLEGWHFHHTVPMATLAISCLCLLSFFAILISVCVVYCGHRDTSKYLPWHSVWVPVFCMLGYFASDITNRIFHELERTEPWEYIGINVGIGSFASIADGLLMVYLLNRSPIELKHAGYIGFIAMILAMVVYWLIGTASKGTQIWNLVVQNSVPSNSAASDATTTPSIITKSQTIFQDLDTVASSMQLLFALGFVILSYRYLSHLSPPLRKRKLYTFVWILALSFLVRNAVKFAFALVYSQLNHTASLGIQLLYMAIYGPLSVAIWASIVAIAAVRGKDQDADGATTAAGRTSYHPVAQTQTQAYMTAHDTENPQHRYYQQQQQEEYPAKAGVGMTTYPAPHDYEPYGYRDGGQRY